MTDTDTRAEWNRLLAADESDLTVDDLLRLPAGAVSLLRLLAESQQALREIRELIEKHNRMVPLSSIVSHIHLIAKTAIKEV